MKELQAWVEFTKQYPPAEIFFGSNKEKQERKCKAQCEVLFTFEPTDAEHPASVLRSMWAAFREFEVIVKLGIDEMKREEVVVIAAIFKEKARLAIKVMEATYKPDQALWGYYLTGAMAPKQVINHVEEIVRPTNKA